MKEELTRNAFEDSRSLVKVEQSRDWWRTVYTVALSEAVRAIGQQDQADIAHVLELLPVLREAAAIPELEALETEIRKAVDMPVEERETQAARASVTWTPAA